MRNISKSVVGAFLIIGSIAMIGCKGKEKNEPKVANETVINMHCFGSDYFSSKSHIRASGLGESMDRMTAIKKAKNEAKTALASSIETRIKSTIDNYVNSREMNNKEQVEEKFEGLSREVVKQDLTNVVTICEKLTEKKAGGFVSYVAVEMKAKDLLEAINERITKEETLRVDYDYEKFKNTFDKEMEKLEKGL